MHLQQNMQQHKINAKKLNPGLVASYDHLIAEINR